MGRDWSICQTLGKSGTDGAECCGKVTSGGKVKGVIRSLVNARN